MRKKKNFNRDMETVKIQIKETIEDIKRVLNDVPPEKSFWVNNGVIVKNIQELPGVIEKMSKRVFRYHVNKEKNDFVKWIDEVIGDKGLAKSLSRVRKKESVARRIRTRIKYLKEIKE